MTILQWNLSVLGKDVIILMTFCEFQYGPLYKCMYVLLGKLWQGNFHDLV